MRRGFTLIEAMVSMVLASVAMIGVFSVLRTQLLGQYDQNRSSDAQDNARHALDFISDAVSQAGFGLPPGTTFGPVSLAADNAAGGDLYNTCPGTDVLDFHARDPRDSWSLSAGSSASTWLGSLSPYSAVDIPWGLGQRLLVVAKVGNAFLVRTAAARAVGATTVSLNSTESSALGIAVNVVVGAETEMVKTYRFRLTCADPAHPTLVLENDLDNNGDGAVNALDQLPLASDIEDFQVTYLVDVNQDRVIDAGDANVPWTGITGWSGTGNVVTPTDAQNHIKAIRISLVGRSAQMVSAVASGTSVSAPMSPLENHTPVTTAADGYMRRLLSETFYLDNRDTGQPTAFYNVSNVGL